MWAALAAALMGSYVASAQVNHTGDASLANSAPDVMRLNVVLSGAADGLEKNTVTLLDNGSPANVQSLQPFRPGNTPAHVIVVIDDVNARLTTIAYERDQLQKFFRKNDGQLRFPFTIAVMTDTKIDIQPNFSQDGNVENQALQKYQVGLHEITRSSQYGGFDRSEIGVRSLEQLLQYASGIPGRKLILFVSPGWPLLSSPNIELSGKQQSGIFQTTARLQDAMLRANVTIDMLNPFGPGESLVRADDYMAYLKGAKKPGDATLSDLSLQVLAIHSGGMVQQGTSDIARMVERSLDDLDHGFELSFVPAPGDSANGYHSLKLEVNRPGITVRMPDEYYTGLATTIEGRR